MAAALTYKREEDDGRKVVERFTATDTATSVTLDAGSGNSQKTITVTTASTPGSAPEARPRHLRGVYIHYSGAATVNVTVTKISGAGAAFNTLLSTMALVANTDATFIPDDTEALLSDDIIEVVAPSGGGGVVCGVSVYFDIAQSI